jgi:hypothetical protein
VSLIFFLMMLVLLLIVVLMFGGSSLHRVNLLQRKRRMAFTTRYSPRRLWRRARKKPTYEVDMPTVRDFILTLQLSLSLAETLAGALVQASRQFGDRGMFGQRLVTRVRSQLQVEPEAVIRALAEDFRSEHLTDLADRLDLAHEGGLSYSEAVNTTLDDIEDEIRIAVEKEIERAPVMLTIPMIIGVFFSALALLGFPLLVVMFQTMTGAGRQGGAGP